MKASNTLITPFLDGVLQDIRGFYPEHDFSYEVDWLLAAQDTDQTQLVQSLCRIGKAFEKSLISGQNLVIGLDESQVLCIGAVYPRFLEYLWSELFFNSGRPHYFGDNLEEIEVSWADDRSQNAEHSRKACAVTCLRQFYLGLSKLTTLECLHL
jgi:hypothetical protein